MYIRSEKISTAGKRHKFKQLHYFRCDNCASDFTRDVSQMSSKRLNNSVKHFCSKCRYAIGEASAKKKKENTAANIGNRLMTSHGYIEVCVGHNSLYSGVKSGYIREHVKVMQDYLGRKLEDGEVVHHIDGDKTNNTINNLDLCSVQEHNKAHAQSEQIIFRLYKEGKVGYCKVTKSYFLIDTASQE